MIRALKNYLKIQPRNPNVAIRGSGIHNKGGFAKRDIPKGKRVIEYIGERISKRESDLRADRQLERADDTRGAVYIFELDRKTDIDGNVWYNTARFINHSCDPNCEVEIIDKHIWIIATRDISKGEEITYDYGYDIDNFEDHPCRCGAKSCVGYIVARDQWGKLKRRLKQKKKQ